MELFETPEELYDTVTQWIRDGSTLIEVNTSAWGISITLKGKDGCREELGFEFP